MRPFDGYPTSFGNQRACVVAHQGPSTYTPVTETTGPSLATGGDTIQAIEAGMKYIDFVCGGLTDSGAYRVECIPTTASGVVAAPTRVPQPGTSYRLRWVVVATGAEAAAIDLSAEVVRLMVFGPK